MQLANIILFDSLQHRSKKCVMGICCTIEYPKGSLRELKNDKNKTVYKVRQFVDYGYIDNTVGRDGDEIDVLIGPLTQFKDVFVIHMIDKGPDVDQREDEDKCILGAQTAAIAKSLFLKHYPKSFYGGMTLLTITEFKKWIKVESARNAKMA